MTQAKRLIEVAMPVKEVSVESVRDKYIRYGYITILHLWWALAAMLIVFLSKI